MQVLKDNKGKWSYSRITGVVIVATCLASTAKIAWATGTLVDMPQNYALLVPLLYGIGGWKDKNV